MLAAALFECLTGKDCKHQILKRLRNASTLYYPEKVLRHFEGFSNELQHQPEQATPALLYAFPGLYLCRYCKHFAWSNAAYPGTAYRRCSGWCSRWHTMLSGLILPARLWGWQAFSYWYDSIYLPCPGRKKDRNSRAFKQLLCSGRHCSGSWHYNWACTWEQRWALAVGLLRQ